MSKNVSVVIGRFQTYNLHAGHRELLDQAGKAGRLIVFVGVSEKRGTKKYPLDFTTRKLMIQDYVPNAEIYPLADRWDDEVWSNQLDSTLALIIPPNADVTLFHGRDSFIDRYSGKYRNKTTEVNSYAEISATDMRELAGQVPGGSASFRHGVIYASQNQYPGPKMCVDMAVISSDRKRILLGRKADQDAWRLFGGFVEVGSLEASARRELSEEAGIDITDPSRFIYQASGKVDDWRYRDETDTGVVSALFTVVLHEYEEANAAAGDDIAEVRWFPFTNASDVQCLDVVHAHYFMLMQSFAWNDEQVGIANTIVAAVTNNS